MDKGVNTMSVTVRDLLKLPSLRNAKVVAGRGGLGKIVTSISVLESTDPNLLSDSLFRNDEYYGSELVITAFINIRDDVEMQCANIKRLAEGGEVGLILFYVGAIMKDIDKRLISLADELNFTLICMPRNRLDLRYSEVICEVMEAIFKDQASGTSMVVELLEHVSRLPEHQQTVDTVLKMLSDRIRATAILTDSSLNVLNEAAWPRTLSGLHQHLRSARLPKSLDQPVPFDPLPNGLLYRAQIEAEKTRNMELFLISENDRIEAGLLLQSAEIVRLAVLLWGQQHDRAVISELVKAIMKDEPLKMRRLADLFNIDIASVHVMWILAPVREDMEINPELPESVRGMAAQYCRTSFADIYDGCLVLFMDGPDGFAEAEALKSGIFSLLKNQFTLTMFTNLRNSADVREAFLANKRLSRDTRRIFPLRSFLNGEEILFAGECRDIISKGEAAVEQALSALQPLSRRRDAAELKRTLEVYLLDTGYGLTETAERLFLHKNTVKYRLKCVTDCLGFRVGHMPSSIKLYRAIALERLLASQDAED
ncbi:MAG: PucR family transcriptional regulator ligand-binding domain-containing protein [Oscillospiraceae bacterium]|jgi:DNA-binding PucR family transcriptional regulator